MHVLIALSVVSLGEYVHNFYFMHLLSKVRIRRGKCKQHLGKFADGVVILRIADVINLPRRDAVFILDEKAVHTIPRSADEMRSKQLFFFESEKLKRIELRSSAKSVALLKDAENEWRTGNIKGNIAEFSVVNDFIEELRNFETKEFVSNDLRDLRQYGLDPAGIQVQIWLV